MWVSRDGSIQKLVMDAGIWGKKPFEHSECQVSFSDCPSDLLQYNSAKITVGDSDNAFRRYLDICLCTMNDQETAKFKIIPENITFVLKLVSFKSKGCIYEWDAKTKLEIAQSHKEKGVLLYKESKLKDAAHRFAKALKLLHSIPINAETRPMKVDDVLVSDIDQIKANLYNNLASCYLKKEAWLLTMQACNRVFEYDRDNVKAHYKLAVAYSKDRNFEGAKRELDLVLRAEPANRAALEQSKVVEGELKKAELKFNSMVKKMFV